MLAGCLCSVGFGGLVCLGAAVFLLRLLLANPRIYNTTITKSLSIFLRRILSIRKSIAGKMRQERQTLSKRARLNRTFANTTQVNARCSSLNPQAQTEQEGGKQSRPKTNPPAHHAPPPSERSGQVLADRGGGRVIRVIRVISVIRAIRAIRVIRVIRVMDVIQQIGGPNHP